VPPASSLGVFAAAALALLAVPGPAVLYIVGQSVEGGRRAGLVSVAGIQAGALVHVAAATLGLSALLVSSATAFDVVKYAGAAYLVAFGLHRLLRRGSSVERAGALPARRLRRVFVQGVVVNVLNVKTALFFFAFLPQFVDPARGSAWLQVVVLGLVWIGLACLSDGAYAIAAGTAAGWLRRHGVFARVERYVSGAIFVGLGVATAVGGPGRKS
jgi:threonine/homoserine/homoserine lactone efflux protein